MFGLLVVAGAWHAAICDAADDNPPRVHHTQSEADQLTPAQRAVEALRVPDGFRVSLFAAEPDVQQPIAVATDDRGRLWVVECYTYSEVATNFDESLNDRIVIFDDQDGDGRFDRRTVFWDEGKKLTGVEVGFGGVWVLAAPEMLFIPDANGDDVPDGPPVVVLDGWDDGPVRHNIVNGLKWGPDGWLYGRHGIQATSLVGKPGASESQRVPLNCSVWRYHPTRGTFEVVTHGTTNSWGHDFDDHGQLFFINTVIGHLWHAVPGSRFLRMYGAHFNPYTYETIDTCADHYHWDTGEKWSDIRQGISDTTSHAGGGHAHCGMMIYLGDNWPDEFRGNVFTFNMHGLRFNRDYLERAGAGYAGKHGPDFLFSDDPWFRVVEMTYGPDGSVYVIDWSDVGECHENDGVHRTSGRIYNIAYGDTTPRDNLDLARLSDTELAQLQLHTNDWFVRHARRILQERAASSGDVAAAEQVLRQMYDEQHDVTRRLRAMWCLYSMNLADETWLLEQLDDENEHIRVWAVKLLTDWAPIDGTVPERFARLAADDPSGLVRSYVASALQRLPLDERWEIAEALAAHEEDAGERALPLLTWYGIEPAVTTDAARAAALAVNSRLPRLQRYIARRLTEQVASDPAAAAALITELQRCADVAVERQILRGIAAALQGRRQATPPEEWAEYAATRDESSGDQRDDGELAALVRDISVVFGDGRALDEVRRVLADTDADASARRQAIRVLVEAHDEESVPRLQELIADRSVEADVVAGLAAFDHPDTPRLVLARFPHFAPAARVAAINTLAGRPSHAMALLDAVDDGRIDVVQVTAFHARQIQSFGDELLNRRLAESWGAVRGTDDERRELIAHWKTTLDDNRLVAADLSQGRLLYEKTCATCHVLYGVGNTVGPDLTGSNRRNLDYLLENIIDPSAMVGADFRMSVIALADGRVINGLIVSETSSTVTVQTQTETIAIPRDDIQQIEPTSVSLMPDGQLNNLSDAEVRDLAGYLMSTSQVPLPDATAQ
jgi:putative membrane-bound dehydrogenase-like protein